MKPILYRGILALTLILVSLIAPAATQPAPAPVLTDYTWGDLAQQSPAAWAADLDRPLTRAERRLVRRAHRLVKRQPTQATVRASEAPPIDAYAVAGFLIGILSLVTIPLLAYSAILLGLLGLTFSLIGLRRTRNQTVQRRGRLWATLGVIASVINLTVFAFLFTIMALIVI